MTLNFPLLGSVLLTSLLSSVHCSMMCGPFALICRSRDDGRALHRLGEQAPYQLARMLVYVGLGGLSGAFGARLGDALSGTPWVATVTWGTFVVILLLALGVLWPEADLLKAIGVSRLSRLALGRASPLLQLGRRPRPLRGTVIGLLTPLLPCGLLYSFLAAAAGTQSAAHGALLMFTFWLGTVPALLGIGFLSQSVMARLRGKAPFVLASAMSVVALSGVLFRSQIQLKAEPAFGSQRSHEPHSCH